MTGRHAANPVTVSRDDSAPWPYVVSAGNRPVVRVADADLAAYAEDQAVQVLAEGWTITEAVIQPLQDAAHLTEGTDWITWDDWAERENDREDDRA